MAKNRPTKKAVFHFSEGGGDAAWLAHYVIGKGDEYHFCIDAHGDVAQLYPVSTGSRALKGTAIDGSISGNRSGQLAVQVCAVGYTAKGWASHAQREKFIEIAKWLDTHHGIPAKHAGDGSRNRDKFVHTSGWYSHAEAPGNDHGDKPPEWTWLLEASGGSHHQDATHGSAHGQHGHPHGQHTDSNAHHHESGHGSHTQQHQHQTSHGEHEQNNAHTPPNGPDELHYLVMVSGHGIHSTPILNKDGAHSGWTIKKEEATEFPLGHIRYEHVDDAIAWAHQEGLIVDKVLRARPTDHHPDHVHRKKGKLTKQPSTEWPLDKRTVDRLKKCAEEDGREWVIVSGHRSLAKQRELYNLYRLGRGPLAAYPNANAPHIRGYAADVDVRMPDGSLKSVGLLPECRKLLHKHGLVLSVQSEAWHCAPEEINHWAYPLRW
jgi:hypothetical protein